MEEISIEKVESFIERENDYTIRLLNKSVPPPKQYIFAHFWFNGNTSLWMTRLLGQNMRPIFEESRKEFLEAKEILIREIRDYVLKGYKVTKMQSGYDIPPWLRRKR